MLVDSYCTEEISMLLLLLVGLGFGYCCFQEPLFYFEHWLLVNPYPLEIICLVVCLVGSHRLLVSGTRLCKVLKLLIGLDCECDSSHCKRLLLSGTSYPCTPYRVGTSIDKSLFEKDD